ncbi:MAG: hypothetical protein S4CHLAM7_06730 [Chlamydiae bacterium]|nr:hypothetical protein [Chlamydiota bacterium]
MKHFWLKSICAFAVLFSFTYALEMDLNEPLKNWVDFESSYSNPNDHSPELHQKESRAFFNQWFTGPLLMPSPVTIDPKTPLAEFSVTVYDTYGIYDNNWKIDTSPKSFWSLEYFPYWQMGFTQKLGCEIFTTLRSNYNNDVSATYFTDTTCRLGYQLLADRHQKGNWIPDFRIILQEIFPTGHYQKLNPNNDLLDSTGLGSFQTGIFLASQKGFKWPTDHAFNLCLAFGYFIPAPVKVKGINSYGGNHFTNGRVYPGNFISVFFSGEFEITNHIAFAFDSNYQQNFAGKFKGTMGDGNPVLVPQSVFFQLAPELELIVSQRAGFLMGPWFTFGGQNTQAFVSFFINFLYTF